jgi:hypothetical protein
VVEVRIGLWRDSRHHPKREVEEGSNHYRNHEHNSSLVKIRLRGAVFLFLGKTSL